MSIRATAGWVTLSELRKDRNIVLYFSNILQKPIWDSDDFITYFEGLHTRGVRERNLLPYVTH